MDSRIRKNDGNKGRSARRWASQGELERKEMTSAPPSGMMEASVPPRSSFQRTLKLSFIPHKGNRFHPHVLHTKHAVRSALFFTALKLFVIAFALFIPAEAFVAPDVLQAQGQQIIALTNRVRVENGLTPLDPAQALAISAQGRAQDMSEKQYFSHVSPEGKRLDDFLKNAHYDYAEAGENLAIGFSDANDVVDAWMKSPGHYANLVKPSYEQIGVGLEGGVYDGQPTVFVAQHFGKPYRDLPSAPAVNPPIQAAPGVVAPPAPTVKLMSAPHVVKPPVRVATKSVPTPVPKPPSVPVKPAAAVVPRVNPPVGERLAVVPVQKPPVPTMPVLARSVPYDRTQSFLRWSVVNEKETRLEAHAVIHGAVGMVQVSVDGYTINLQPHGEDVYQGALTVPESSDALFHVVITPTITIATVDGALYQDGMDWQKPKVVSQTPWQRYIQAKSWLGKSVPVFVIVQDIYLAALFFFAAALGISLCMEFRKQHPHVVLRTVALLALLVLFLRV